MIKITEQPGPYRHLEKMPIEAITSAINKEDQSVPLAIEKALTQINNLIHAIIGKLTSGGRLAAINIAAKRATPQAAWLCREAKNAIPDNLSDLLAPPRRRALHETESHPTTSPVRSARFRCYNASCADGNYSLS